MIKRMLFAAVVLVAAAGSGLVALADPPSNVHGMCTAYFNGSENGQGHKHQATAFQNFASYVGNHDGVDNDGDNEVDEGDETADSEGIFNWCSDEENNPKGIGGKDHKTP